jgi:hypothetical protein
VVAPDKLINLDEDFIIADVLYFAGYYEIEIMRADYEGS